MADNKYGNIIYSTETTFSEKFDQLMAVSPYAAEMSDLDLKIANDNPEVGISLLLNKEAYYATDDPAQKAYYHDLNEASRSGYISGEFAGPVTAGTSAETKTSVSAAGTKSSGASQSLYADSYAPQNVLPSARSAESYLDALYKAQQEENLRALKSAYDDNVYTLSAARSKIPQEYESARNRTASDREIEKYAFNEYASARGLGTGAEAQARLSIDNAMYGELGALANAQSNKLAEADLKLADLETKYQNDIAYEIAKGNYDKAKALYSDFVRVDDSYVDTAYRASK